MVGSSESFDALLPVSMLFVLMWFLFSIPWHLDRLNFDSMLARVAIARIRDLDWCALSDHSWFPDKYRGGLMIVNKVSASLKRVLLDGSELWHDGGNEVCSVYCVEFESLATTKEFVRAAWLRYVSDGDD